MPNARRLAPAAGLVLLGLVAAGPLRAAGTDGSVPLPPEKPAVPPLPPEKPPELGADGQRSTGAGAPTETKPTETKPAGTGPAEPATPAPSTAPAAPTASELPNITLDDEAACEERLHHLGAEFVVQPPIAEGVCVVPAPLEVRRLTGGVALSGPATLNCATAESLARWASEFVAPAVRDHLGATLTTVTATGYACRTRNGAAGAPVSEHATANAVDVMAFGLQGKPAFVIGSLAADDRAGHALEDAVRRGACSYFETVLGPGADPEHANHLHLDHRARQTGYRICQ